MICTRGFEDFRDDLDPGAAIKETRQLLGGKIRFVVKLFCF